MRIYLPFNEADASFQKCNTWIDENVVYKGDNETLSEFINNIIHFEKDPCLLLAEDACSDKGFAARARAGLMRLQGSCAHWGLAGNGGYGSNLYGIRVSPVIRYFSDLSGGPNLPGRILPVQYLESGVLLLNAPLLREKCVFLPDLGNCGDFVGTALSLAAQNAGLGCFALPELLVFHNSLRDSKKTGEGDRPFIDWVSGIVSPKRLPLSHGSLALPKAMGNMDPEYSSLECCAPIQEKTVCIVVRTRFQSKERLWRTLTTINAFIAASGHAGMYRPVVISDLQNRDNVPLEGIPFVQFALDEPLEDSRFFLIRQAVMNLESDYFWFVDDDDWLFPNMARFISLSIQASPPGSSLYTGSRHFREKELPEGTWPGDSHVRGDHYYDPKNFYCSIFGHNHIPFCGMIFPAECLKQIFTANDFDSIVYFEDYTLEQMVMYREDFFPVVIDCMAAGISVREKGNTITKPNSTLWNISECAMFSKITQNANILISIPPPVKNSVPPLPDRDEILAGIKYWELKLLLWRKVVNKLKYIWAKLVNKLSGK